MLIFSLVSQGTIFLYKEWISNIRTKKTERRSMWLESWWVSCWTAEPRKGKTSKREARHLLKTSLHFILPSRRAEKHPDLAVTFNLQPAHCCYIARLLTWEPWTFKSEDRIQGIQEFRWRQIFVFTKFELELNISFHR